MKIILTGSRGFVGHHLKYQLQELGHEIDEWDTSINRDISLFATTSNIEADYFIHLAARADVRASIKDPEFYWQNNVKNTTQIQWLCHNKNIPLMYASSSCIHNWWLSPYGTSKKVNEETAFAGQTALRFTTVYGSGARESMFIGKLLRGEVKHLTNHIRDFIHVDDVVDAILLLLYTDPDKLLPAYDIGTGKGNSVEYLGKMMGLDVPVTDGESCEAKDNTADNTALRDLGWEPKVNVEKYLLVHKNGV